MDKFIVSARKYRPQNFNTVVGQSHITTTLKNAIKNNQLAHAFLFCGPRGVGKTTCARILAKTINCTNKTPEGEACNTCNSCVSFDAGTSLNIHELDAASNNSVDDIRSLVEQVRFAPQAGKYKVYIVDEVHMLSTSAFNAFLKTLEEPPGYAIFILATTEKHKILPTILSRCQIFDFKRITTNDTVEHLQEIIEKEGISADKASLQVIAQKSEGCMRDALSILDKIVSFTNGEVTYQNTIDNLNILDEDYYFKLLDAMVKQDLAEALILYDEINRKGFEGDMVLDGFAEFIRNILVCKDAKAAKLLEVVEGMQERYAEAAKSVNIAYLVSALNILNEAEINFKMARNKRLHVELTFIKLSFLQQAILFSTSEGVVSKKKQVDSPIAYSVKPVPQIQIRPVVTTTKAKLIIQPGAERRPSDSQGQVVKDRQPESGNHEPQVNNPYSSVSSRVINSPQSNLASIESGQPGTVCEETESGNLYTVAGSQKVSGPKSLGKHLYPTFGSAKSAVVSENSTVAVTRKTLLEILREKAGNKYNVIEVEEAEVLNMEKLSQCWEEYAVQLEKDKKHSSSSAFRISKLNIENDIKFTVTVFGLTSQRFVDLERMTITDYIQQKFRNRAITFSVIIQEEEKEEIPQRLMLNNRQRFERIVEQYPLVKELKDRLKLELD
jgi:DNA polymerase-3 subunit gamma/tau